MSNSVKNTSAAAEEWRKREIGALWKRQSPNQKYLSGKVKLPEDYDENEFGIVIFSNKYKEEGSKQPDFRVYLERKRDEDAVTSTADTADQAEDLL